MGELASIFKKPKMPEVKEGARLPDTEDPTVKDAGRRRIREEQMRGGRESTNLTGTASAYASKDLGL